MSVKLGNLVYDWIQNDPVLKEHLTLSFFDDGFFIETKCGGKFTMAWIGEEKMTLSPSIMDDISPNGIASNGIWNNQQAIRHHLNPADPEYFKKLEAMCREWHNSFSGYTYGCKEKL